MRRDAMDATAHGYEIAGADEAMNSGAVDPTGTKVVGDKDTVVLEGELAQGSWESHGKLDAGKGLAVPSIGRCVCRRRGTSRHRATFYDV
jgi:hypothetical protein